MSISDPIIDVHCHPNIKPYGCSLSHSAFFTPSDKSSPWFHNTVLAEEWAKLAEDFIGYAPYRQSDFVNLKQGNVAIAFVSFYPVETGFTKPKKVPSQITPAIVGSLIGLGQDRAQAIMAPDYNYWLHYLQEYNYMTQVNNGGPEPSRVRFMKPGTSETDIKNANCTYLVNTIEGAHTLCNGHDVNNNANWLEVEARIVALKKQTFPPFFITFAHHFINGLCSHSKSLMDIFDQNRAMEVTDNFGESTQSWISQRGYSVLNSLLSNKNGKPILIDVKHMALQARREFYEWMNDNYSNIPFLYSHGGVRGKGYSDSSVKFYDLPINLDEFDVINIIKSGGIIGMELDQRILGYNELSKKERIKRGIKRLTKPGWSKEKEWAEPLFHNIRWIIETVEKYNAANNENLNPWKHITIGSDFDGIINPINQYYESARLPRLKEVLIEMFKSYFSSGNVVLKPVDVNMVMKDIFYTNGLHFLINNYK